MGIAAQIHEGATVLVVLNALRLLRFEDGANDSGKPDIPVVNLRSANEMRNHV